MMTYKTMPETSHALVTARIDDRLEHALFAYARLQAARVPPKAEESAR